MNLRQQLSGGDRRMNHMVKTVIAQVNEPVLFAELTQLVENENELVRMRAADAIEKITKRHPDWLQPYAHKLVNEWSSIEQQEVRWHIALLFPRVQLTQLQRQQVIKNLMAWLQPTTKSSIVRVFSLQALFELKVGNIGALLAEILDNAATPPSLRTRAKKLFKQMSTQPNVD